MKETENNKWHLNRAGVLNYWYYSEEYFDFSGGRMLIRGQNGAGKSVTMQSFIPLLIDGKRSPERLDPFNSKARKLENYLLGEYEISGKDSGTGYLFLEFKKNNSEIYSSIGMGMRAKQGQGISEIWYFVLKDNRRIGEDIFLYETVDGEKLSLSRRKLENLIGDGGIVTTSQGEYAQQVNKLLFGYESMDDFEEMVDLIVKVRTPKLSRDMKPSNVYEVLQSSLPGLSEDDLRQLSDSIENLDTIQTHLAGIKSGYGALQSLKREYDRYNRYMLYEKSKYYNSSRRLIANIEKNLKKLEKDYFLDNGKDEELRCSKEALRHEEQELKLKQEQLREREEYKLSEKLANFKLELAEDENKEKKIELRRREKYTSLNRLFDEDKRKKDDLYEIENKIQEEVENAICLCEELMLLHHRELLKHAYEDGMQELGIISSEASSYKAKMEALLILLSKTEIFESNLSAKQQELDRLIKEVHFLGAQLEQSELQIEEQKNLYKENSKSYLNNCCFYKLEKQQEVELFQAVNKMNSVNEKSGAIDLLGKVYQERLGSMTREQASEQVNLSELKQQEEGLLDQITNIKNQQEQLYPTEELKLEARRRLEALGIPHMPLYMAVEFADNTNEETKALIEQGLIDMGLLDSLIIPEKYRTSLRYMTPDVKDSVIEPQPQYMAQTLLEYIAPGNRLAEGISTQEVTDAIASIRLDPQVSGTYISEEGHFGIGIISGRTTSLQSSRFIGIESRKRHRQSLIEELTVRLEQVKGRIEKSEAFLADIEENMQKLKAEYTDFIDFRDLDAAFILRDEQERQLKMEHERIEGTNNELQGLHKQISLLREEISKKSEGIQLRLKKDTIDEAISNLNEYQSIIVLLEKKLSKSANIKELINLNKEKIETTEEEIEYLDDEIRVLASKLQQNRKSIEQIEAVLSGGNIEEIKLQIEHCIKRLNGIPKELDELAEARRKLAERIAESKVKLEGLRDELNKQNIESDLLKELLQEEIDIAFVQTKEADGIENKSREIEAEYEPHFKGVIGQQQRDELAQALNNALLKQQAALLDYNPNMELMNYKRAEGSRYIVSFKAEGSSRSLYQLMDILKGRIEEFELLIQNEERKLFEEILANSISSKISARIKKAKIWIENMNSIMRFMDTSSGLRFQLKWEAKGAQTEDELNTAELVKLLDTEAILLKDSDRRKITNHFRARINKARKYRDDGEDYSALHVIMREVLDYRQWFEFKLFYQKTGESRRELSNNAYDKFSGGEKALSLYVPLLASLYAKYDGARKDAPRIIAMDEAFAGVDENNIESMFALIESLGFNFIMNSQSLWGDYKTVPALTMYELIRQKNSSTVLKVKYVWTGKEKIMLGFE